METKGFDEFEEAFKSAAYDKNDISLDYYATAHLWIKNVDVGDLQVPTPQFRNLQRALFYLFATYNLIRQGDFDSVMKNAKIWAGGWGSEKELLFLAQVNRFNARIAINSNTCPLEHLQRFHSNTDIIASWEDRSKISHNEFIQYSPVGFIGLLGWLEIQGAQALVDYNRAQLFRFICQNSDAHRAYFVHGKRNTIRKILQLTKEAIMHVGVLLLSEEYIDKLPSKTYGILVDIVAARSVTIQRAKMVGLLEADMLSNEVYELYVSLMDPVEKLGQTEIRGLYYLGMILMEDSESKANDITSLVNILTYIPKSSLLGRPENYFSQSCRSC